MTVGTIPRLLSACISEGRSPLPEELAFMQDKVWREVFASGSERRDDAARIALAAFFGGDVDLHSRQHPQLIREDGAELNKGAGIIPTTERLVQGHRSATGIPTTPAEVAIQCV
jgi:hypothetical protein